jgi:hypothetical protein
MKRVERTVDLVWDHIRDIRELVMEELQSMPEEVQTAAAMTSSELLENAVKYADDRPPRHGTFTLEHSDDILRIEISNLFAGKEAIRDLSEQIDRISAAEDKGELYVQRLTEIAMMDGESIGGRLGLYRIAFEGNFDLELTSSNDVVTVIATRRAA